MALVVQPLFQRLVALGKVANFRKAYLSGTLWGGAYVGHPKLETRCFDHTATAAASVGHWP